MTTEAMDWEAAVTAARRSAGKALLSLRSSYQNKLRSHLYPATIGKLPWSEALVGVQADLDVLREPLFAACRARFDAAAELKRRASALPLVPLNACFRRWSTRRVVSCFATQIGARTETTSPRVMSSTPRPPIFRKAYVASVLSH
jgi:hypothetical protein